MTELRFIPPAAPVGRATLPGGDSWLHEPKLDGWRIQAHKVGPRVTLMTRNGFECTRRFPAIAEALQSLPASSAILDGELVSIGEDGLPDFAALHRGDRTNLRLFGFDLLHLDGLDFRSDPLTNRKALLEAQLGLHQHPAIRIVEAFDDGDRLLAEAELMGLEGVVSKRRDAPYRSGPRCGWVKVKTSAWRAANAERGRLFSRDRERNGGIR
jgi:bifunctional non-homologous end joining protein LigD